MQSTMGIDQYGVEYHDLGPHPRKALMERFYTKHVDRMFADFNTGPSKHVGYIVRGHWIRLYNVTGWEKPV